MAIYHFTVKTVSFGKGQSAVATAAYNARTQLYNERDGTKTSDYNRASAAAFTGVFAPKDAPEWAHDREQLWNRAEAAENRIEPFDDLRTQTSTDNIDLLSKSRVDVHMSRHGSIRTHRLRGTWNSRCRMS